MSTATPWSTSGWLVAKQAEPWYQQNYGTSDDKNWDRLAYFGDVAGQSYEQESGPAQTMGGGPAIFTPDGRLLADGVAGKYSTVKRNDDGTFSIARRNPGSDDDNQYQGATFKVETDADGRQYLARQGEWGDYHQDSGFKDIAKWVALAAGGGLGLSALAGGGLLGGAAAGAGGGAGAAGAGAGTFALNGVPLAAGAGGSMVPAAAGSWFTMPSLTTLGKSAALNGAMSAAQGGDFFKGALSGLLTAGLGGFTPASGLGISNPILGNAINSGGRALIGAAATGGDVGGALGNGLLGGAIMGANPAGMLGIDGQWGSTINRTLATGATGGNMTAAMLNGIAKNPDIFGNGLAPGGTTPGLISGFFDPGGAGYDNGGNMFDFNYGDGLDFGATDFSGGLLGGGGEFTPDASDGGGGFNMPNYGDGLDFGAGGTFDPATSWANGGDYGNLLGDFGAGGGDGAGSGSGGATGGGSILDSIFKTLGAAGGVASDGVKYGMGVLGSLGIGGRDLLQMAGYGVMAAAAERQAEKQRQFTREQQERTWAREDTKETERLGRYMPVQGGLLSAAIRTQPTQRG